MACQSSRQTKEVPLIQNRNDNKVKQRNTLKAKQETIDNSCEKEIREKHSFVMNARKDLLEKIVLENT